MAAELICGVRSVFGDPFPDAASIPGSLRLHRLDTVMSHQCGVPIDEGQEGVNAFLAPGKELCCKAMSLTPFRIGAWAK